MRTKNTEMAGNLKKLMKCVPCQLTFSDINEAVQHFDSESHSEGLRTRHKDVSVQLEKASKSLHPVTCVPKPRKSFRMDEGFYGKDDLSEDDLVLKNHIFKEILICAPEENLTQFLTKNNIMKCK